MFMYGQEIPSIVYTGYRGAKVPARRRSRRQSFTDTSKGTRPYLGPSKNGGSSTAAGVAFLGKIKDPSSGFLSSRCTRLDNKDDNAVCFCLFFSFFEQRHLRLPTRRYHSPRRVSRRPKHRENVSSTQKRKLALALNRIAPQTWSTWRCLLFWRLNFPIQKSPRLTGGSNVND